MEFSEQWLREWVNPNVDIHLLCNQMTKLGLEVEKIVNIPNICTNLIVGEIIECVQCFNFTKLLVIIVNVGINKYIRVISRNFNFTKGMKVIIATKKSKLFNLKLLDLIKHENIQHDGIICFCEDIGLLNSNKNILELLYNAKIGSDVKQYLSLDDNIIKISSTPNRSDALSVLGIARDIAIWNNVPRPYLKKYCNIVNYLNNVDLLIQDSDVCSRFFGRVINGVDVNVDTPFWMFERLKRSSLETSNIIINIINYVLIELGQPLYIIDLKSVLGKIIVRKSHKNESFITYKNKKIFIENDVIVISDQEKILMLGGHVHSRTSSIDLSSTSLFLGCVSYYSFDITKTFLKYGCKNFFTERYERGVDLNIQYDAIEYVTYLILKFCGGQASNIVKAIKNKKKVDRKIIKLYRKKLCAITGCIISGTLISNYLERLGFEIIINDNNKYWLIKPPSWRFDINIEEDVISELLRIYGYENIYPSPLLTRPDIVRDDEAYTLLNRIKLFLVDQGYHEVITHGFVDPNFQKFFFPNVSPLCLSNPISKEMSSMRMSLWCGLLSSVIYNQNRQENKLRLFESGLCFLKDSKENLGINQSMHLSGILSGYKNEFHWDMLNKKVDFYDVKGDVESILDILGKLHLIQFKNIDIPGLHPKQSTAIFLKDKRIGIIGVIHPYLERQLGLKNKTIVFELIWHEIAHCNSFKFTKISEYPRSTKDISIIVDETISVGDIILVFKQSSFKNIVNICLFDIFRGNKIGIGKKSLTFRLVFENRLKTFTEEEILKILQECILILKLKFNAVLRDN
ncbi:MAG: phenylalanine--tRNA ligase subunit beta [Buchnera aphidicola (Schlechtendalia peitan)]